MKLTKKMNLKAILMEIEEQTIELRNMFDDEKSDDAVFEHICVIEDLMHDFKLSLDLKDEMNIESMKCVQVHEDVITTIQKLSKILDLEKGNKNHE
ncbi:hypothetical protein [Enterococcus sp. DIV0170]|uniref:hypothetical protein n=1 Tax=Enterococcus sp. DIV0170 TaxID=2774642 RepID=UPI003F229FE1